MNDLNIQASADFSQVVKQFQQFFDNIQNLSTIPSLTTQVNDLSSSFQVLMDNAKNLDTILSTSGGIRQFNGQLNSFNKDTRSVVSNITQKVKNGENLPVDVNNITALSKELNLFIANLKVSLHEVSNDLKANKAVKDIDKLLGTQNLSQSKIVEKVNAQMAKVNLPEASKLNTGKGLYNLSSDQLLAQLGVILNNGGSSGSIVDQLKQFMGSRFTPTNSDASRDKNLQAESTMKYNIEKKNLEDVIKLQERSQKYKKENLTAGTEKQSFNNDAITRIENEKQALMALLKPESMATANNHQTILDQELKSIENDKNKLSQLKQQNDEYAKAVALVDELISTENKLAKNNGNATTKVLTDEKNRISKDLMIQKQKLTIDQRSNLNEHDTQQRRIINETQARTTDTNNKQADDIAKLKNQKIQEIDNYLNTIDNKIETLRQKFGTFIDEPAIKAQIDKVKSDLDTLKNTDPTKFNRTAANNTLNTLTANINNSARQEGLSSPSAMYSKIISLIKEESSEKLKLYKMDEDDNGMQQQKVDLITSQKTNLQDLLDKYQLLTDKQKEGVALEQQKADYSYNSGVALINNNRSKSGSVLGNNFGSDMSNGTNSVNTFYNAFSTGNKGVIAGLMTMQSKLFSLRFMFQGFLMATGLKELYNQLIGTNAQIEVLQKSMEVTLKSADKARETIQSLRSYAALTPFQETETFQAGEMLASNKMDVNRWIASAGDLAAAKQTQGIQLNDVIQVITRINSGDFGKAMIRLRQMGISLSDFRNQGLKFSKNNTFLGNSSQMLDALENIIKSRYGGMTNVLGQTVTGSLSTIKDYFKQLSIDLGSTAFSDFRNSLQKWKKELQDFRNSTQFKEITNDFNKFYESLKSFGVVGGPLLSMLKLISTYLPEIATYIKLFATIKIGQSLFQGLGSIISNWTAITKQQQIQNSLIVQSTTDVDLQATAENTLLNALAKVVALRKLGLKYASETQVADAVAAGNAEVKGLSYAGGTYTGAAALGTANIARATQVAQVSQTATQSEALAAGALARTGATAEGVAGAGATVGGLASASALLGNVLLFAPLILMLVGTIRNATDKVDNLFSADDYERRANDKLTASNEISDLNIQRQTAKAQIDYYQNTIKSTKDDVNKTAQAVKSNPNDDTAQTNYNNAVHADAYATSQLTNAQKQLTSVDQQMIQIAPELAENLYNQNGVLTDNTEAFKKNTDSILANIDQRNVEISNLKEQQLLKEKSDSATAQKKIDEDNKIKEVSQYDWKGQAGWLSTLENGANSVLKAIGLDNTKFGMNMSTSTASAALNIAAKDKKGQQQAFSDLDVDINDQQSIIAKSKKDEATKQDAINHHFVDSKGNILWNAYQKYIDDINAQSNQYLFEEDGVSSSASDIESSGDNRMDAIKNKYQVKLNDISQANAGKTDSKEYIAVLKQRNQEVLDAGKSVIDDLNQISSLNKNTRKELIAQLDTSKIAPLTDLIKNDPDIKFKDIQDALTQISTGTNEVITGKLSKYQDILKSFYNSTDGLNKNLDNLNLYADQINRLNQLDNNTDTIEDEINKATLKMQQDSKDNNINYLTVFNDEWERKRKIAEDAKEVSLQQSQLNNNLEGTQKYKTTMQSQDEQIRQIIMQEIDGLNQLLASGNLSDDDAWQAKQQITDLQKEANTLALEVADKNKSALDAFHEKYDNQYSIASTNKDIALQKDQLAGYDDQSTKYLEDEKSLNMSLYQKLIMEIQDLNSLIPTLDTKDQIEAQLQSVNLQKDANQLLVDIKKNTSNFGEFNAPGFVKVMTYYDYMTKDSKAKSIEVGNASFVFQIETPQNEQQVDDLVELVKESMGKSLTSSNRTGTTTITKG